MTYEVELKFPLQSPQDVLSQLEAFGAEQQAPLEQRDVYFAHPNRNFAETDEALRVRCVGDENCITYKGPIVDSRTKTRREIEIPFQDGELAADQLADLLKALGFEPVRAVIKTRIPFQLICEGREVDLALDEVTGLGSFLEIETIADQSTLDEAQRCIIRLAERLRLKNPERRSYLCMLLQKDG